MHWMAGGRASALPAGVISKAHTSSVTYRGHLVYIGDIKCVTGFGYRGGGWQYWRPADYGVECVTIILLLMVWCRLFQLSGLFGGWVRSVACQAYRYGIRAA